MGIPNKQEMEGKFDKAKGAVKENVGRAIDNEEMETEGKIDRVKGDVKEGVGNIRREAGETIENLGDKIKR
jgi:uncharacterized protein YjbJ (UPF0337 family)